MKQSRKMSGLTQIILAAIATASVGTTAFAAPATAPTTESTMLPPAAGQSAMPTTGPATAPAVAVDSSTPRGAIKLLISSMEAGDGAKIKSVIATTSPSDEKMVTAMADMSIAQKKFREAAETAFGPTAKEVFGDAHSASQQGMAKIDEAKETIEGDKATVDPGAGAGGPPLTLSKSGDSWKIPISDFTGGVEPSMITQRLDDMNFMTNLLSQTADEMSKGIYKTPKDVTDSIQAKGMARMMKHASTMPASSQPAGAEPTPAPAPAGGGAGM